MKSIYFRTDKELIYFCEIFFQMYHEIHVQWKRNKYWGNELQFSKQEPGMQQLVPIFVEVFIYHRLDEMIRKIIEKDYFYSDDAEIDHICELTKWLMADEKTGRMIFNPHATLFDFIYYSFQQHMSIDNPIHFDALLMFCMKPLSECLIEAVGFGIDEMKREEEHQGFVHAAREYVQRKQSKLPLLYIVQGEVFQFYKPSGQLYSTLELRNLMQKEALYLLGLDENEYNIAPVLTLLPEEIHLFGDDHEEPKTIALMSMFQERVRIFPAASFPFATKLK